MSRQRTRLLLLLVCGLLVLARLGLYVLSEPSEIRAYWCADEDCSFLYLTSLLMSLFWLVLYGVIALLLLSARLWAWPGAVCRGIAILLAVPYALAALCAVVGLLSWASPRFADVMALYGLLLGVTLLCWWRDTLALLGMSPAAHSWMTTRRSVPDSAPQTSPGRPSNWRTLACSRSLG